MCDTVVVPLDGSPHAEFASPHAIDEARRHGAMMVLVYVLPRSEPCTSMVRRSGPLPWQGEWPTEEIGAARRDAHADLGDVVTRFALHPQTTLCVAVGDPGVRIVAEAKRHDAGLDMVPSALPMVSPAHGCSNHACNVEGSMGTEHIGFTFRDERRHHKEGLVDIVRLAGGMRAWTEVDLPVKPVR